MASGYYNPLPIIQPSGRRTIGMEFTIDDHDIARCPLCGADLADDLMPGYGFAYGGGIGTYWYCTSDSDCPWFYKEMDDSER